MGDHDYIIGVKDGEHLEDGSLVLIVGENVTDSRNMVTYGPKTSVIAYGTFLSAVGLFLDIIILVALGKLVTFVKGTNRFLLASLTVVQVVALVLVVPLEIAREYLGQWYLGGVVCQLWTVLGHVCVPAMLWICIALGIDRICHIRKLSIYSSRNNGYKTPCLVISVVIFSIISVAPLICWMATEDFILEEVCAVVVDRVYTSVLTTLCYFVPALTCLAVNIALFVVTSKKINNLRNEMYHQESQMVLDPKTRCGIHSRSCRTAHDVNCYVNAINNSRLSVTAMSSAVVILWAPFYVINMIIPFCEGFCVDPRLWALLQWIGYSGYIVCPCLYFLDQRIVVTVKSWINGRYRTQTEMDSVYNKSSTESEYSSKSLY